MFDTANYVFLLSYVSSQFRANKIWTVYCTMLHVKDVNTLHDHSNVLNPNHSVSTNFLCRHYNSAIFCYYLTVQLIAIIENCKILVFIVYWCWGKQPTNHLKLNILGKSQMTNMINILFGQGKWLLSAEESKWVTRSLVHCKSAAKPQWKLSDLCAQVTI